MSKLTKNFEYIEQIGDDDLVELIYQLEESARSKSTVNDNAFATQCGILIETVFQRYIKDNEYEDIYSLNDIINWLKHKKGDYLPQIIWSAISFIKSHRNKSSHGSTYRINNKYDKVTMIELLRSCHIFLEYMLNEWYDEKTLNFNIFNSNVYLVENIELINNWKDRIKNENVPGYNKFDITKTSIARIILDDKTSFYIPPYQRTYIWSEEDCSELLNDIIIKSQTKQSLYLGVLAITREVINENNHQKLRLIDGQQRITTTMILLRALYDIYLKHKYNIPKELDRMFNFLEHEDSSKIMQNKIKNDVGKSEADLALQYILLEPGKLREHESWSYVQAVKNYKKFLAELGKIENVEELNDIFSCLVNNCEVAILIFDLQTKDEMETFENLNSKGSPLTLSSLAKNHIFNLVDPEIFYNNEKLIVDMFNKHISVNLRKFDKKQEKDRQKAFDEFLTSFISYKIKQKSKGDTKTLLSHLKKVTDEMLSEQYISSSNINIDQYEKLIKEIGKYAFIYTSIRNKNYEYLSNDNYVDTIADELNGITHKDVIYPYIYWLFDKFAAYVIKNDTKTFYLAEIDVVKKMLFVVEIWFVRMIQVEGTGQSLLQDVLNLIKYLDRFKKSDLISNGPKLAFGLLCGTPIPAKLENQEYSAMGKHNITHQMPSQKAFYESLLGSAVNQVETLGMQMLKRLHDYYVNKVPYVGEKITWVRPTVEHIMPKTLGRAWVDYLLKMEPTISDETSLMSDYHSLIVNKIGNLVILNDKLNSSQSNNLFGVKQGRYRHTRSPLLNAPFNVLEDKSILTSENWTKKEIDERTEELAKILAEEIYADIR